MVHIQFRILGKGEVCGRVELSLTSLLDHNGFALVARIELIGSFNYCVAAMLRFVGRCDNRR